MKELLCALLEHQRQGRSTVMVSVTASSGSVPRGAGARMLVGSGGRICGTIGGGAVEYEAERFAAVSYTHLLLQRKHSASCRKQRRKNR